MNAEELLPEPGNPSVQIRQVNAAVLREFSLVTAPTYDDAFINRYQTIEVTSEPTVANNFVTVRGYADRANHAEIPQAFANVTIIISPGPFTG